MNKTQELSRNSPLVSLWAANECISGGILHAFNLPFKGLYLSAFSAYVLTLLNRFYNRRWVCAEAGLKVSAVKIVVNPFASINSHLAVLMQSSIGELFRILKLPLFINLFLFSFIILILSAIQRLAVLWVFFGMSIYNALNILAAKIISDLTGPIATQLPDISYYLVLLYFIIHMIAAIPFAMFCYATIIKIESSLHGSDVKDKFTSFTQNQGQSPSFKTTKRIRFFPFLILTLVIIATYFIPSETPWINVSLILLRFAGALIILKLIRYIYKKVISNTIGRQIDSDKAFEEMNKAYSYLRFALQETKGKKWYIRVSDSLTIVTLLSVQEQTGWIPEGKDGPREEQPIY